MKNLKKIKGDASFRQFYRKKNKDLSSIIVFAKKDKPKKATNVPVKLNIRLKRIKS